MLAALLTPNSFAQESAPASLRPRLARQVSVSDKKQIDELLRLLDRCQVDLDHLRRTLVLRDEKEKLDAEAIKLRDDKISLLNEQIADSRKVIEELKLAGNADQSVIKALKEEVVLLNKEVKALKLTGWLQGRASILLIFGAAVVGFLLGKN